MRAYTRVLMIASLLLVPAASLLAQTSVDPSGHWEGAVRAPNMEVKVEVDLAKNSSGELAGTFGNAAQGLKGLPLANVAVDGASITFQIKGGASGDRTFKGTVSEDRASISGQYTQGTYSMPFTLARAGDARIEPPVRNAQVGKNLEGTWNGTLEVNGMPRQLVLTLANQPDGTASGSFLNVDEGLEIPITTITQHASNVTLDVKAVGGSFSGAVNPDGTELAGTLTQGSDSLPLTLRRTAAAKK